MSGFEPRDKVWQSAKWTLSCNYNKYLESENDKHLLYLFLKQQINMSGNVHNNPRTHSTFEKSARRGFYWRIYRRRWGAGRHSLLLEVDWLPSPLPTSSSGICYRFSIIYELKLHPECRHGRPQRYCVCGAGKCSILHCKEPIPKILNKYYSHRPNFHIMCLCTRFIDSHDRSAYSAAGKYVDRSW